MLHSGSTGDFVVEDDLRDLKALVLQGFERLEGKIRDEAVETREYVDLRFGQLQTEVGELRTEMRTEFGDVRTEFGGLHTEMARQRQLIGTEFAKATRHADALYGKLREQIALQSERVTRVERRGRRRR